MKLTSVGISAIVAIAAAAVVFAQGPRQVALVISNGIVVTVDGANRIINPGAVAIDGANIVGVGTVDNIRRQFRARDTIDATGQVVMPGLVNTHTHAPMVLFRGLADDLALQEWLTKYIFPAEARTVSPEFVRAGTRLAALEMIESGTTTFTDMYYFEEEVAKETKATGLRGPGVVAAHAVWVNESDLALLKSRGVAVSHNPESNMKLASGIAPVKAFLASGVAIGLGTDGAASNNDLDMFEAMRAASFLQKVATSDPTVLGAKTALRMATLGGARTLGMDKQIGSLESGKRADIIVVSMNAARQTPMYDPVSHLVYVTRGDDVQTTIVNGRILMRNRKVTTLDAAAVLKDARRWAGKVRAAGAR